MFNVFFFFFSSRRRHTRSLRDWSSDVCSSDLGPECASALSSVPSPRLRRSFEISRLERWTRVTGEEVTSSSVLKSPRSGVDLSVARFHSKTAREGRDRVRPAPPPVYRDRIHSPDAERKEGPCSLD